MPSQWVDRLASMMGDELLKETVGMTQMSIDHKWGTRKEGKHVRGYC